MRVKCVLQVRGRRGPVSAADVMNEELFTVDRLKKCCAGSSLTSDVSDFFVLI